MFQQQGALILLAVLAYSYNIYFPVSALCEDYSSHLCTYVSSTGAVSVGRGWTCSNDADAIIVYVDGREMYNHCNYQQQIAALQGEDIPKPPPPSDGKSMEAESNDKSQLIARILSILGFEDKASAQSCTFPDGQRLCLYISRGGQSVWYCSDQSDVIRLDVQYQRRSVFKCD